jgi:phage shock protein A
MVRVLESLRDQRAVLSQEIDAEEKQKAQLQKQLDALNFKVSTQKQCISAVIYYLQMQQCCASISEKTRARAGNNPYKPNNPNNLIPNNTNDPNKP